MNGKNYYTLLLVILFFGVSANSIAQQILNDKNTQIEKTEHNKRTDIISFLSASKEHATLLNYLKSTGLDELFSTEISFTLFAPTNAAFEKLPKSVLEAWNLPENSELLKSVLNNHIITTNVNIASISESITEHNGKIELTTKNGAKLTVFAKQGILTVKNGKHKNALIETSEKLQTNGSVHIVDTVILPQ
ncbi:fasciclin domain-containing protein [Lacinutrix chionoecetis]